MYVCADLNSAPEVHSSVIVKNFKKNADVLRRVAEVFQRVFVCD